MTQGRTIRMFLVDGSPGGIITAEIMNWTGHVLCAPRSRLPDLIKRDETKRTGIYFLSGIDPETGNYYDDTRRYIEASKILSSDDRFQIYEGNARRVYPRLDAALKARGR